MNNLVFIKTSESSTSPIGLLVAAMIEFKSAVSYFFLTLSKSKACPMVANTGLQ